MGRSIELVTGKAMLVTGKAMLVAGLAMLVAGRVRWQAIAVARRALAQAGFGMAAAALVAGALSGCAATGGVRAASADWTAYAAEVYAMPAPERDALQADIGADYAAQGGADRAIRLAIVLAAPGASAEDLAAALGLLESAEVQLAASAADGARDASRNFIGVLRPLLVSLQERQSQLAAESLARESLEDQLEQLKSLEEALNASVPQR